MCIRDRYSTDAGATWTTAVYDSMDFGYPVPAHAQYAMNLTGAANVRIRFTWTGTWDWWWAIDNVEIIDYPVTCATPPNAGTCLLYTSDAADERSSVDFGGRRFFKNKKH